MILYHFCSEKHIKSILRSGLTKGAVTEVFPESFIIHQGWMWLTLDPDPKNQSWATQNAIKYSRRDWRLTIEIPNDAMHRVYDRKLLTALYPQCALLFDGFPGSENWRVFHGMIPKSWIVDVKEMK